MFNRVLQVNFKQKMIKITASQRKDIGSYFSRIAAIQGTLKNYKIRINSLQERQLFQTHLQTETDRLHIKLKWLMKVLLTRQTIWTTIFPTDILGELRKIMSMISQSALKSNLKMSHDTFIKIKMNKRSKIASKIRKALEEIPLNNTSTRIKEQENLIQTKAKQTLLISNHLKRELSLKCILPLLTHLI